MSLRTLYLTQSTTGAKGDLRPSIVPTRRRLDRRFPSLGFTVTAGAPWAEVLLATDPSLFAPERASERSADTFYASRTTGGLTQVGSGRARYVVPPAVVARLARSATSLWYLAIAYPDSTGVGGVPSAAAGASGAVVIDPSYRAGATASTLRVGTLSRTQALGASPDRLEGEDGADVSPARIGAGSTGPAAPAAGPGTDRAQPGAGADRLEGEDAADLAPAASPLPVPRAADDPAAAGLDGGQVRILPAAAIHPRDAVSAPPPAPGPVPTVASQNGDRGVSPLDLASYDDGWNDIDPRTVPALAESPLLGDDYPDIDWGDMGRSGTEAEVGAAEYGEVPAYRGLDEPGPVPATRPDVSLPTLALTPEAQRRIIELTAGGDGAAYATVNADGPFRGRLGPGHKAYQRYHTGLSFGIADFNQDDGPLGQLLRLMRERDPDAFVAVFGPAAGQLVDVASAVGPSGENAGGDRGARVQPVDGADLWEEPWLSRFRAAAAIPAFRAAQNQLAAELYFAPVLPVAAGFGLTSERALCMVLDRAIALGPLGARRWIADTVGPVSTPALRHEALSRLGFDSIEAFQAAVPGLLDDGEFGPVTHATLTALLRAMGPASPVPVPTPEQMVVAMAHRGEGESGAARLVRLATTPGLGDAPLGDVP